MDQKQKMASALAGLFRLVFTVVAVLVVLKVFGYPAAFLVEGLAIVGELVGIQMKMDR